MAITQAELKGYLSANMPTDDSGASGGAIDATGKFELTQPAAADRVVVVSDGADTRTITVTGRDASGAIISDAIVLNGTTPVNGASGKVFERILQVTTSSSGTRTVTITRFTGGAAVATMEPLIVKIQTLFYSASSQAGATVRYEKVFYKNTNASLTLTSAQVTLTGDPAAKVKIACAAAVDDSGSTPNANRLSASAKPAGLTFVDDGSAQSVPGNALAAASGIGIWLEQSLGAGAAAFKDIWQLQMAGTTT